jgi:hypothetical protein
VLTCLLLWIVAPRAGWTQESCGRECLRATLDRYFDAVFAHDPGAAPLAAKYRATENGAPLSNGTGIWRSATGYGAVARRFFDAVAGQVAFLGIVQEQDGPALVSLRLAVEHGRVREAEWTVARQSAGGLFSVAGLIDNPPPPDEPLPAAERGVRPVLVATADAYFDGLQKHDGSRVPHVAGCKRVENGVTVTAPPPGLHADAAVAGNAVPPAATAAMPGTPAMPGIPAMPGTAQEMRSGDCTAGFENFAHTIAETSHRRFPVVDEAAGVVMGTTLFHRPPSSTLRRNLLTEYFYEKQGRITAIYAVMFYLDPAAPDSPGW